MAIRLILLLAFLSGTCSLQAQDPQFSQFYAIPLYMNPAFSGNTLQGRVISNYRHQWAGIPGAFVSYAFSYDYNFRDANSGAGIQIVRDRAGTGGLRYTSFGGTFAHYIRVSRTQVLRLGMGMAYIIRDVDFARFTFGDQLVRGGTVSSVEPLVSQAINYVNFDGGAVFHSDDYWVGVAAHHLNRPNMSFRELDTRLPIRWSVHGGVNIALAKTVKKQAYSVLTFAMNYKSQQLWDQFDVGAYWKYKPLYFGMWFRGIPGIKAYEPGYQNNDAVIPMLGYKMGDWRFAYSYDITISRLLANSAGSHEISLIYEYASPDRKRRRAKRHFMVPCAKF